MSSSAPSRGAARVRVEQAEDPNAYAQGMGIIHIENSHQSSHSTYYAGTTVKGVCETEGATGIRKLRYAAADESKLEELPGPPWMLEGQGGMQLSAGLYRLIFKASAGQHSITQCLISSATMSL